MSRQDWCRTASRAVSILVLSGTMTPAGEATEFKTGEQVVVEADQVVEDDLYMTGDTMTVRGRVLGDVVAAGRIVRVVGTIEGDLVAAAQVVEITGDVEDDVRIAGLTLKLGGEGRVRDDLFAAGFSFESEPRTRVGGRTGLTGYQARLAGEHGESVEASLIGLEIGGRVAGNVSAIVDGSGGPAWWASLIESPVAMPQVPAGLTVTGEASIDGDLAYESFSAGDIASAAVVTGEIQHTERVVQPPAGPTLLERVGTTVRRFVLLLLLGAALLWLAPRTFEAMAGLVSGRTLPCLGWGVVTLLAFPVAAVLVLVLTLVASMAFGLLTLRVGVTLSLVIGIVAEILLAVELWVLSAFVAPLLVGFAVGHSLLAGMSSPRRQRWASLLLGLALLTVLMAIPILGPVIYGLVVLTGLGALALWLFDWFRRSSLRSVDAAAERGA